jgi:hypothetical protein
MQCLAISDAPLPERLANAWISALSHLQHPAPDWGTIPVKVSDVYRRIQSRLDQPSPDNATLGALAAARALPPDDALQVARDIAELHDIAGPL